MYVGKLSLENRVRMTGHVGYKSLASYWHLVDNDLKRERESEAAKRLIALKQHAAAPVAATAAAAAIATATSTAEAAASGTSTTDGLAQPSAVVSEIDSDVAAAVEVAESLSISIEGSGEGGQEVGTGLAEQRSS